MNNKEIRELTPEELGTRKRELREESFHLRIQQQSGQLEKPSTLRDIRREIARIETVLTQKTKAGPAATKKATSATTKKATATVSKKAAAAAKK